jgi:hypothetical protein
MKSGIMHPKVHARSSEEACHVETDIRGILAEEEEVQRRKDALKSLLNMRSKQLRVVGTAD